MGGGWEQQTPTGADVFANPFLHRRKMQQPLCKAYMHAAQIFLETIVPWNLIDNLITISPASDIYGPQQITVLLEAEQLTKHKQVGSHKYCGNQETNNLSYSCRACTSTPQQLQWVYNLCISTAAVFNIVVGGSQMEEGKSKQTFNFSASVSSPKQNTVFPFFP